MGSIFKTTRRNQDLDMELKVKLQKPINKKEEEKRKWKCREKQGTLMISSTPSIGQLANGEIIKDRAWRRPSLFFYLLHFKDILRVWIEAWSALN